MRLITSTSSLTVPGLDGIFIGPMDLASSLGHLGDPGHPDVQAVIRKVEGKVLASDNIPRFTDRQLGRGRGHV